MHVDAHQHVWTEPLLAALAGRRSLPYITRADGLTVLHSANERPYVIDVEAESPDRRAELLVSDRLDAAVVAVSSPIGIEALPRESADRLIDAQLTGVSALGERFAAWGPIALEECVPDDVDALLARGCIGISLPAGTIVGAEALEQLGPVLDRIAARDVPLIIHPGPSHSSEPREAALTEPLWWRALTDYVSQMQAAWLTFVTLGRRELATRGGPPIDLHDPCVFYDTSSYGPAAIEAMARTVGTGQLLYGSDRPVVEPVRTEFDAVLRVNSERLLIKGRTVSDLRPTCSTQ